MKEKTLVILAAGMGSRYGGLKQIEPFGPNGELIIDYSIFDAKRTGFDKIVFVIKEENYELFKEVIGNKISNYINVSYVFQKLSDVPNNYFIPEERVKPLGTAHAIYSARNEINGDFAIINADDFYGYDAFKLLSDYLDLCDSNEQVMIGYKAFNTVSLNGSVKRGICSFEDSYLKNIDESILELKDNIIYKTPIYGGNTVVIDGDTLVSMNLFGFKKEILNYIEEQFIDFLEENKNNLLEEEFFIPSVVFNCIKKGQIKVKVISTDEIPYGVTYKEDKNDVVNAIKDKIEKGIYPSKLWN